MSVVWSLLGFVVVMGLIVTIHEWGHYQVARWFNIKVLKFSIGFGKPIYSRKGQETEFVIAQIPLGGYVKFADEREDYVAPEDVDRAFNRQSVYKRFAVVAAGPLVNLVFALFAFTAMYMVGVSGMKPISNSVIAGSPLQHALAQQNIVDFESQQAWVVSKVNDVDVYSWQTVHQQLLQSLANGEQRVSFSFQQVDGGRDIKVDGVSLSSIDINQPEQNWLERLGFVPAKPLIPAVIGEVIEKGPADKAGMLNGDKILTINEKPIQSWQDFVKVVQANPGASIQVVFERNQAVFDTLVQLEKAEQENSPPIGKMGVGVLIDEQTFKPYSVNIQYGFLNAVEKAYQRSVDLFIMSVVMIKRMIIGEVSTKNLSGPISIAQFSGQAIQTGLVAFLSLVGLLSLSIGILNLLPIPVLDGGHLVYYLIEMIKGSPVSERVMVVGQTVGLMFIVSLTFVALFNDVIRISHG
ncbi:zinc metalloprotease [Thiomicrorhabdus immobilis]|uniref:Zinc metalloprotease n=1 Tax=Thiomicrorhabdus immobilis TaxID=2791037 RepID=A0ABM7MDF9_9GAMM|nr:RIP metalloprotease RseP [Thiomicrorhabdus immobilis]BCN93437.1 zinc metalloprotease [Thiomicrorhabdus immobilis]